jgi:hypothetical protein
LDDFFPELNNKQHHVNEMTFEHILEAACQRRVAGLGSNMFCSSYISHSLMWVRYFEHGLLG